MEKKQKASLISISRLLIFLDIIILIVLTQNIYINEIIIYSMFRVLYLSFRILGIVLKIGKTALILIKRYTIFSNMHSSLSDEEIYDSNESLKNLSKVFIFFFECMIPILLLMYTMQSYRDIIRSNNDIIYFSGLILLNIVLELISTYIKKRTIYIIDSSKQKKSKVS